MNTVLVWELATTGGLGIRTKMVAATTSKLTWASATRLWDEIGLELVAVSSLITCALRNFFPAIVTSAMFAFMANFWNCVHWIEETASCGIQML